MMLKAKFSIYSFHTWANLTICFCMAHKLKMVFTFLIVEKKSKEQYFVTSII